METEVMSYIAKVRGEIVELNESILPKLLHAD